MICLSASSYTVKQITKGVGYGSRRLLLCVRSLFCCAGPFVLRQGKGRNSNGRCRIGKKAFQNAIFPDHKGDRAIHNIFSMQ